MAALRLVAFRLAVVLVAVLVARPAPGVPSTQEPPRLDDVLERARRYVEGYQRQAALILCDETTVQESLAPRKRETTGLVAARAVRRVLESEFLLVWIDSANRWVGFRDVAMVDGKPVPDRKQRLEALLLGGGTSLRRLREVADESARFNVGPAERNFNEPTFALRVLAPPHSTRFRFRPAGEERLSGHTAWKVRFEEAVGPTFIRSGTEDAPIRGMLWIDPVSGRVHRTETRVRDTATGAQAKVVVDFEHEARLDMWVPSRMKEDYGGGTTRVQSSATYSRYRRFETSGRLLQ